MAENQPVFELQKIYLKDVSFESPLAPSIFRDKWKPSTDVQLATENQSIQDDLYEVTLNLTITTKQEEQTAFLVEVKQCGVFKLAGFDDQQKSQLLGAYCPATLFPFAREAVSDLVTKGGFPQLLLSPVNFDMLYAQQLQNAKQQAASENSTQH